MTQYIYVKYDGGRLTPAPKKVLKTGGILIDDYNAEKNSEMLLKDGYKSIDYSDYQAYIDGKMEVQSDGTLKDITSTSTYIAKQKTQQIQQAKLTRDKAINEITNAKLLDDLQLDAGTITQAIYDARKTARLAQLAEVQTTFYTTTGLPRPTTITA